MSSAAPAPKPTPVGPPGSGYAARLLLAIDSVPETRGLGVKVAAGGTIVTLRGSPPDQPFVLIELRPPLAPAQAATAARAASTVSVGKELANLALNLGGATLSWIGVAGTAAVAPETGGLSLAGTALIWTGAVASSVQVGNSVARLTAIYTGHGALVEKVDHMRVYTIANDALDLAASWVLAAPSRRRRLPTRRWARSASGLGKPPPARRSAARCAARSPRR